MVNLETGKGLDGITAHNLCHPATVHASQKETIAEMSNLLRHQSTQVMMIYLEQVDVKSTDRLTNDLTNDLLPTLDA